MKKLKIATLCILHGIAFLPNAFGTEDASVTNLRSCIGSGGTANPCVLDPGAHDVESTLMIERTGITIQGTSGDAGDALLRRSTTLGLSAPIIQSAYGVSFTIQYLTIDGNRQNTEMCTSSSTNLFDADFQSAGVATVQFMNFISGPERTLGLGTVSTTGASTVTYSNFGQGYSRNGYSRTAPQTAGRWQVVDTLGDYTGVWYNNLAYAGLAAIQVYSGNDGYIIGNTLQENRYEQPDGISGGQILIEDLPSYLSVANNYINGNYWTTTGHNTGNTDMLCNPGASGLYPFGIEASGTGHRYFNNEITQNLAYGILLRPWNSTEALDSNIVSGYDPFCTGSCSFVPHYLESNAGCYITASCYSGGGWPSSMGVAGLNINNTVACCGSGTGTVSNITLDHVRSQNNSRYGVSIYNASGSPGFVDSVNGSNYACLTGNSSANLTTSGSASVYNSYTNLCP